MKKVTHSPTLATPTAMTVVQQEKSHTNSQTHVMQTATFVAQQEKSHTPMTMLAIQSATSVMKQEQLHLTQMATTIVDVMLAQLFWDTQTAMQIAFATPALQHFTQTAMQTQFAMDVQ